MSAISFEIKLDRVNKIYQEGVSDIVRFMSDFNPPNYA